MQDEHQLHNTVNKPITCTVYMYKSGMNINNIHEQPLLTDIYHHTSLFNFHKLPVIVVFKFWNGNLQIKIGV